MPALSLLLILALCGGAWASAALRVNSVTPVGNQTDTHLAPIYPVRDGGAVGSLGGKIVWFWSDTSYMRNGQLVGFYGNTAAIGTAGSPLVMNGPERQAIPFTSDEQAFNNQYSNNPRVVLWPKSGVVEVSSGNGVLYVPKGYWGNTVSSEPNQGIVVSTVTIGSDGYPSVTRLSATPIFPLNVVPSYGNVAATKDSQYVYLYSADQIGTYSSNTFVARAPLASATVKSAFQYYHASTSTWTSTPPAINSTADAVFTSTFGIDGNVYYSAYHALWIFIYSNHADYKVYLKTATAPQGPWTNNQLIYTPPPSPTVGYIYGTTGTNLYDTTGGKTASIDFTWCYSGSYANWVAQVNFA